MLQLYNVYVRSKGVAGHPSANYLYHNPVDALGFARKTRDSHRDKIVSITILEQFPGNDLEFADFGQAKEKRETEIMFVTTWPDVPGEPWTEKFTGGFEKLIKDMTGAESTIA
jgi:hypothetical protein